MKYKCGCGREFKQQQGLSQHGLGKGLNKGPCPEYTQRKQHGLPLNINIEIRNNKIKKENELSMNICRDKYYVKNMITSIIDNIIISHDKIPGLIYLVREREFIFRELPIYKIGKTRQPFNSRMVGYPKGTEIILAIVSDTPEHDENSLKVIFKNKYDQRLDIGAEYFEGSRNKMLKTIVDFIA